MRSASRLATVALTVLSACARTVPQAPTPTPLPSAPERLPTPSGVVSAPAPAPVSREFRGVWVATVGNIDWPSKPGLTTAQQKAELVAIMDRSASLNLNAVIFQVRTAADALYESPYEPWSEFLSGEMGRAPEPRYDPLAFAIEEAHARGLELHAWFNPYRARYGGAKLPASADHISRTRPELVKRYGPFLWMDPGEPEVQATSLRVIRDVVKRYDVDGVHIDDYFYPYKVQGPDGRNVDFPDDESYRRYTAGGGTLARNDWRRRNVDEFVRRLYREVKDEKPWVRFGISPFGIWRPGYPQGISGLDAYAELYADSRKWLREGWADYFTPQLYWTLTRPQQSYTGLMKWWVEENVKNRHMWIGNIISGVGDGGSNPWSTAQVVESVGLTRAQPNATGNVFFSMKALMQNKSGVSDALVAGPYLDPALVPATPWLGGRTPRAPRVVLRADTLPGRAVAELTPAPDDQPWLWVVRARYGTVWTTEVVPGRTRSYVVRPQATRAVPDEVRVSAVNRLGEEGQATAAPFDPEAGRRAGGP
jgi:uncharacterized lipoprotein YddW (UPF0748 family)